MDRYTPNSENDIDQTLIGEDPIVVTSQGRKRSKRSLNVEELKLDAWNIGSTEIPVLPFNTQSRLKVTMPTSELGFFRLFITEYIISYMVQESNRYAKIILGEEEFQNFSKITIEEMNNFISLIIFFGINKLPSYELYWQKKNNPFYNDFCSKLMAYDRFNVIKRYFHVFDNDVYSDTESNTKKISKLDGLIGFFNKKFHQIYEPERDLSVDENMCSWSGKGGSKVYMPLKPIKYGIKLYAMCESKSGYACSIIQYNSKGSESNVEMLKRLTSNYTHKFHHLYMDNFYSSKKVFDSMFNLDIYCCGTLRDNRGGPKNLKKTLKKFKKGEGLLYTDIDTNCLGMMDNGPVVIMTNIHSIQNINVDGESKIDDLKSSIIVKDYNKYMGGVDLMDQMTKYYGISRRSKKWTTKLCFHLLNIAFHNSYVLYKKYSSSSQKKSYLKFLTKIMCALSGQKYEECEEVANNTNDSPLIHKEFDVQKSELPLLHYPIEISKRLRCRYCSQRGIRKEISSSCSECKIPLCVFNCFEKYHNGDD